LRFEFKAPPITEVFVNIVSNNLMSSRRMMQSVFTNILTSKQKKPYIYHENQRRFYSADAARVFEGLWKGLTIGASRERFIYLTLRFERKKKSSSLFVGIFFAVPLGKERMKE
jgi:hypothetical protein